MILMPALGSTELIILIVVVSVLIFSIFGKRITGMIKKI